MKQAAYKSAWLGFSLALAAPAGATPAPRELRIQLDNAPATLNPRLALDAAGQRLDDFLFRALIQLNSDLNPEPDLAASWQVEDHGLTWRFRMRKDARDQSGAPIGAAQMAACLENFRVGKPTSPYAADFPLWKTTESQGDDVLLRLTKPDPYLLRNLVLLRYFRTERAGSAPIPPCTEPQPGDRLIGSGIYRPVNTGYDGLFPESDLSLVPAVPTSDGPRPLHFFFSLDETTKALRMLRGQIDIAHYSLAYSKTHWFIEKHADRFQLLAREGVPVTYLAFNLKDPILGKKEVRRAIALALDREAFARDKFYGLVTVTGTLLHSSLAESAPIAPIPFDPAQAERLLDQTGFPRGKNGVRFEIKMKTTPSRDGLETAKTFQAMLERVGIDLKLDVVEPAVFFASVRKRNFQLYASRWLGLADGSIFYRILRTGRPDNRASYSNPEMDRLIDRAISEPDDKTRIALMHQVQKLMAEDLPYLPLWHSKITVLMRPGLTGLKDEDLSLSGSLMPLVRIR